MLIVLIPIYEMERILLVPMTRRTLLSLEVCKGSDRTDGLGHASVARVGSWTGRPVTDEINNLADCGLVPDGAKTGCLVIRVSTNVGPELPLDPFADSELSTETYGAGLKVTSSP